MQCIKQRAIYDILGFGRQHSPECALESMHARQNRSRHMRACNGNCLQNSVLFMSGFESSGRFH